MAILRLCRRSLKGARTAQCLSMWNVEALGVKGATYILSWAQAHPASAVKRSSTGFWEGRGIQWMRQ